MKQFVNFMGSVFIVFALCHHAQASAGKPASVDTKPGVVSKVEHAVEQGAKATVNGIEHGGKAVVHGLKRGGEAAAHGIDVGVKATTRTTHRVVNKLDGKASKSIESGE